MFKSCSNKKSFHSTIPRYRKIRDETDFDSSNDSLRYTRRRRRRRDFISRTTSRVNITWKYINEIYSQFGITFPPSSVGNRIRKKRAREKEKKKKRKERKKTITLIDRYCSGFWLIFFFFTMIFDGLLFKFHYLFIYFFFPWSTFLFFFSIRFHSNSFIKTPVFIQRASRGIYRYTYRGKLILTE